MKLFLIAAVAAVAYAEPEAESDPNIITGTNLVSPYTSTLVSPYTAFPANVYNPYAINPYFVGVPYGIQIAADEDSREKREAEPEPLFGLIRAIKSLKYGGGRWSGRSYRGGRRGGYYGGRRSWGRNSFGRRRGGYYGGRRGGYW